MSARLRRPRESGKRRFGAAGPRLPILVDSGAGFAAFAEMTG